MFHTYVTASTICTNDIVAHLLLTTGGRLTVLTNLGAYHMTFEPADWSEGVKM